MPGLQADTTEVQKLQAVEKHLSKCTDARKVGDWKSALREGDSAIAAGADYSPQVNPCLTIFQAKWVQVKKEQYGLNSSN